MGLMDKFKNLFTDEEIIEEDVAEVEIKEIKKDEVQQLPTFMREKIEKEKREQKEDCLNTEFDIKKEIKLETELEEKLNIKSSKIEENNSFKFPLDLNDNDFIETRSRQSIHQQKVKEELKDKEIIHEQIKPEKNIQKLRLEPKVADLYKDKKEDKTRPSEKKFRATPIISPIYGVLDKNYTPNDISDKSGENFERERHSKNVDFDSVRKKAYGNISKEIKENLMCENCEYLKEVKECKKEKRNTEIKNDIHVKNELLYEIMDDNYCDRDIKDITLDEATENYYDYGVEYEKQEEFKTPIIKDIIEEEALEEVKIVNHEEPNKIKKEIPPVKSSINLLSTLKKSMGDENKQKEEKNLELTDDLFNLIDSMYDERNEIK